MAEKESKRDPEGTVSLQIQKRQKCDCTDYSKCIICQKTDTKPLYPVQPSSSEKLHHACDARQGEVAKRLLPSISAESWLETNTPKWHDKCRKLYNNENYKCAERKRLALDSSTSASVETPMMTDTCVSMSTRSHIAPFDSKTTCVICGRKWYRWKEPEARVSTNDSQKFILDKAKKLNRQDICTQLVGHGHDMVDNDICYHIPCMNNFKAKRVTEGESSSKTAYDVAFEVLVDKLEVKLFQKHEGHLIKTLRDEYRQQLREDGVQTADGYRSSTLKAKLLAHFGSRVSVLEQSCEPGFLCASNVPLGDALEKLNKLEKVNSADSRQRSLTQAAKILREDA